MKYLVREHTHKSLYGDIFCVWWGYGKNGAGYVSDLRLAHRFTEDELGISEGMKKLFRVMS